MSELARVRGQRDRAIAGLRRLGVPVLDIAAFCGIPERTLYRILQRQRAALPPNQGHELRVIGRQMGHHAETNVRMPQ